MTATIPVLANWSITVSLADFLLALVVALVTALVGVIVWVFKLGRQIGRVETRLDERERELADLRPLPAKVAVLESKVATAEVTLLQAQRDIKASGAKIAALSAFIDVLMHGSAGSVVASVVPFYRHESPSTDHGQRVPGLQADRYELPREETRKRRKTRSSLPSREAHQLGFSVPRDDDAEGATA